MSAGGTGPVWAAQIMLAYDRQGKYLRQVMPFPASLKTEEAKGFDVVELNGGPAPLVHEITRHNHHEPPTRCRTHLARKAGNSH